MASIHVEKLNDIKKALNSKFYEREQEIEGILVALLSRQHMLLIGPAGTAKSALSMGLAKIVQGTTYFQWLLTRFSTPEEVFGPLSLKDLEQGVYKRVIDAKMPEAHLVFLDEIFKANSAILNSLLTLINERLFYNDGSPTTVPLMSVIGASNEFPEEGEGLEALFDRFLLRYEIDFIAEDSNFMSMMKGTKDTIEMPHMTLVELQQLQLLSDSVDIPTEIYELLAMIRIDLRDEGIRPSDRRFKQALNVLQARALVNGRKIVKVEDIRILEHVLWETVEQKDAVSFIIHNRSNDVVADALYRIQNEATEVYYAVLQDASLEFGMEASEKMKSLVADLETLKIANPRRKVTIDALFKKVSAMQHEVLNIILEPWYVEAQNKNAQSTHFKM